MKDFYVTWDTRGDYMSLLSDSNISSDRFLWEETEQSKIYIFKWEPHVHPENARRFLLDAEKNNIRNKRIICINPAESCPRLPDFPFHLEEEFVGMLQAFREGRLQFVCADDWSNPGTLLGTKAHLDAFFLNERYTQNFHGTILKQNYRPFFLSMFGRRGHERRYRFFQKLHSLNDARFFLKYSNLNSDVANTSKDEYQHLKEKERDGITFPYSSHAVLEPVPFHAKFSGTDFMYTYLCLLSMSKLNVVVDTCNTTGGFLTEKSLAPFIAKTIPVLVNGIEHNERLEKLGFHTFIDEFGIRDIHHIPSWEPEYYTSYFSVLDRIHQGEFDDFYENNLDKIEHNYYRAIEIQQGKFDY